MVRSARKTISVQVTEKGEIIVRAPKDCGMTAIEQFLYQKQLWILQKQQEAAYMQEQLDRQREEQPEWNEEDYRKARELARQVFNQKVKLFAGLMKVDYGRITIRDQKTRWGSCSAGGNLNFNWRLILAPEEVLDYVVVHELAHRREMNHSIRFWALVEEVLPDYRKQRAWLRRNGEFLMNR